MSVAPMSSSSALSTSAPPVAATIHTVTKVTEVDENGAAVVPSSEGATTLAQKVSAFITTHRHKIFWAAVAVGFISAPISTVFASFVCIAAKMLDYKFVLSTSQKSGTDYIFNPEEWFINDKTTVYATAAFVAIRILSPMASGIIAGFMFGSKMCAPLKA